MSEICIPSNVPISPKKMMRRRMVMMIASTWLMPLDTIHLVIGNSNMARIAAKVSGTRKGFAYTRMTTIDIKIAKILAALYRF
jgi:hypothetical protein